MQISDVFLLPRYSMGLFALYRSNGSKKKKIRLSQGDLSRLFDLTGTDIITS
jgi:hypothetical protein